MYNKTSIITDLIIRKSLSVFDTCQLDLLHYENKQSIKYESIIYDNDDK